MAATSGAETFPLRANENDPVAPRATAIAEIEQKRRRDILILTAPRTSSATGSNGTMM
jgi:hypothetical protein